MCRLGWFCPLSSAPLTIWGRRASLALQPQRRPETGPVIEAPALLHFSRAPSHQLGAAHHLVARGTALPVVDGRLSALHALTAGARHSDPLLKTQLLTAGREGVEEEESRRGGEGKHSHLGWRAEERIDGQEGQSEGN